ncbi:MAG TPA: MlaD family protein [Candidatus Acidoferrum sp.]|jgi:paraquat-inducible protein B|nr:MlaD family protein [Candidatus Acidoferrum sp.]
MSKKANPTIIGLFFAIGLALAVTGLLIFSSRSLFHPQHKTIVYFNASLKGLNPGAPVKFRGVTIGSVVDILIRHNQAATDFSMPVVIAIDKKLAQIKSDEQLRIGDKASLDQVIGQGLRARLDSESLVTGVLYVALDIIPDAAPPTFHQIKPEYQEIPSVTSDLQQLMASVAHLNLQGLSEKLGGILAHVDLILGQLDMPTINAEVTNLLGSANQVVNAPDLTNSLTSLRRTLDRADVLVQHVDGRVDPLVDSATNTLNDARKTLAGLRVSLQNVSDLLGPDSAVRPGLAQALEELGSASRSVADLADLLKRDPNALLVGKKSPKELP